MRRPKVLHLEPDRFGADLRDRLEAVADVTWLDADDPSAVRGWLRGAQYDAIFTRIGVRVDEDLLAEAPGLRWVVTPTTGLDHLDLAALERRGVELICLRGQPVLEEVSSTAEHTWALLLSLVRRLPAARAAALGGAWSRDGFEGLELRGRTLAVLGCGRLGRMVARYGQAFGMRVLVHDPNPASMARVPTGAEVVDLDALLREADVLSLHATLDDTTAGIVSRGRLAELPAGSLLVNTARGELLDEAALLDALRAGHVAGAALDVLAGDASWPGTVPADHPLVAWSRANPDRLLLTPHVGGCGHDALRLTRAWLVDRFAQSLALTRGAPT